MLESSAPERPASAPLQAVVLGMHRSGTSVLTDLLRALGFWAGTESDFPPADRHNEAGYWEHRGVWSVNEAILQGLGRSWCNVARLDWTRLDPRLAESLRQQASTTLGELDRHGPWVIKDPRLCLLLPFWRPLLHQPFCILIHRDPLSVARSLAQRDGLPIPFGIALWEAYTRAALANSRGLHQVVIAHRDLLADPVAVLTGLHAKLVLHGLDPVRFPMPAASEILLRFQPRLVHQMQQPQLSRAYLTSQQLELLEALEQGTALELGSIQPLSPGAVDLLESVGDLLAGIRCRTEHDHVEISGPLAPEADVQQVLSWLDLLDQTFSALLRSRALRIGQALTAPLRRLLGGRQLTAIQRRDQLMTEAGKWRREREQARNRQTQHLG